MNAGLEEIGRPKYLEAINITTIDTQAHRGRDSSTWTQTFIENCDYSKHVFNNINRQNVVAANFSNHSLWSNQSRRSMLFSISTGFHSSVTENTSAKSARRRFGHCLCCCAWLGGCHQQRSPVYPCELRAVIHCSCEHRVWRLSSRP